jgi:hypothetical protein
MSLEQKHTFDIATELTFNKWEKEITLTRNEDGFCNITLLRRGNKVMKFDNFKTYQKEFLAKIKEEIGEEPIKSGAKRSTWAHEKTLERILRWYDVDEEEVIDKFVRSENRIIGQYKYDKVVMLVHLESKCVNASKFCNIFGEQIKKWLVLESTQKLIKLYCKTDLMITNADNPADHVIRHGLGYDSDDVWIPKELLPMLATWCSPEYALFASKVLIMFHDNPLKLIPIATQKHDLDNDTLSAVAVISTSKDNPEEHGENLKKVQNFVIEDAYTKTDNPEFQDKHENKQSEKEFRDANAKYIHSLKGRIKYFSDMNTSLSLRMGDMDEQFAPVRALMNDHPGTDVGQLALTRKAMLDKSVYPLEKKLIEKDNVIKTLQAELLLERKEKAEVYDELSIAQGTHDEEAFDKDEYIEHLESGYAPKKGKKSDKKVTKTKETKAPKAFRPEAKFELEEFGNHGITSAAPPGSCSHLSVYTKRDHDGKNMVAFVPGRSTNYKELKFVSKGIIKLDEKKTAEHYLDLFTENNRDAFIKYEGLTFTLDSSHNAESFERLFCKGVSEQVVSKHTSMDYKIGNKDAVCAY